jgi:hypothetical protein
MGTTYGPPPDVVGYEFELLDVLTHEQLKQLQRHYLHQTRFYVPVDLPADHPLVKLLGIDVAKKLSDALGGSLFAVTRSLLIRARNESIKAERAMGLPAEIVGRRHGVAARTVRRICQGEQLVNTNPPFGLRRRRLQGELQGLTWNDGPTTPTSEPPGRGA